MHTKGEWKDEGFCVKVGDAFDAVIAECDDYRGDGLSNAKLIAAAPDLLEACKDAVMLMNTAGLGTTNAVAKLHRVILKAEGTDEKMDK